MDKEKRFLLRWPVDWPAKIRVRYNNVMKNFACQLKDISFKGFMVCLKKELPDIDNLKLSIEIVNETTVFLKGKKLSHKVLPDGSNLYSFQILQMQDIDKDKIYELIRKNYSKDLTKQWWKDIK